eukprot:TRINITY_DN13460_c0_g1_i1.p1 TRINITY_DN13460_c0_g1~~TRINITY_DN13460_c0_g1_i1.p1  ORF type:complete len:261 (-),score=61.10 TRINITY_DN13460_c0_g1_i1:87-869(-)
MTNDTGACEEMDIAVPGSENYLQNRSTTIEAVELQKKLDQLRQKINQLRAEKGAGRGYTKDGLGEFMRDEPTASGVDLHRLTSERTQTFLNFTSMQTALRAVQANEALTTALGLEEESSVQLPQEEYSYVKELLEEQKELSERLLKTHDQGSKQELQIIEARTQLAHMLFQYQELRNEVGPLLLRPEDKDKEMSLLEAALKIEAARINQLRMVIQKLMIGEDKFGMKDDGDTAMDERYKEMFLRCGMKPEELWSLKAKMS